MTSQGLIGFRYRKKDRLVYNHADSEPDILGLRILHELRNAGRLINLNWEGELSDVRLSIRSRIAVRTKSERENLAQLVTGLNLVF